VLYGASAGSIYAPGAFCTSELMIASGLVTYFADMYSYHPAGGVTAKRLWMARGYSWNTNPGNNFAASSQANVDVDYTYDSAGRTATITYPMAQPFSPFSPNFYGSTPAGTTLTYGYDSMGRPNSLTDASGATGAAWGLSGPLDWVQNVQHDYAGRLSGMQYITYMSPSGAASTQKTMGYNVNGQLNSLGWAAVGYGPTATIAYTYSATQNNGQISQVQDQISGETIVYQYDALKRLTSASSTPISGSSPAAYTQTYQYDGFGNLTAKVLNGTSTPIPVNAATNRLSSASYDANGNMTSGSGATMVYDEANRISSAAETSGGTEYYGYSADNKRFYKHTPTTGTEQLTFYGARGEKLGMYTIINSMGLALSPSATNIWFAGKLILESNQATVQDRLGTNRSGYVSGGPTTMPGVVYANPTSERFYPYGDEITSTLNDHEKFATYTRDSYTGFDYADQRYYASTYGRFNTADPYMRSARASDPESWNRYSYTRGDPINRSDPSGQADWGRIGLGAVAAGTSIGAAVETGGASVLVQIGVSLFSSAGFAFGTSNMVIGALTPGNRVSGRTAAMLDQAQCAGNPVSLPFTILSMGNLTATKVGCITGDILSLGKGITDLQSPNQGALQWLSTYAGISGDSWDLNTIINPDTSQAPVQGAPITINIPSTIMPVDPVPSPTTRELTFPSGTDPAPGNSNGTIDFSGTPTFGGFDVSGFEAAGFGGCGPAYCPNQN
jgi:RHS repeat-associated protein